MERIGIVQSQTTTGQKQMVEVKPVRQNPVTFRGQQMIVSGPDIAQAQLIAKQLSSGAVKLATLSGKQVLISTQPSVVQQQQPAAAAINKTTQTSELSSCQNRIRGCEEVGDFLSIKKHELWCVFRLVKCPRISCGETLPFHSVLEHMESSKDISVKYSSSLGSKMMNTVTMKEEYFKNGSFTFRPVYMTIDGEIFFSLIIEKSGLMYHWIQLLGSRWEASKFCYTLEYFGCGRFEGFSNYRGPVLAIDESPSEIEEHCKCFTIAFKTMKSQFIDEESRRFKYSVKIERIIKYKEVKSG